MAQWAGLQPVQAGHDDQRAGGPVRPGRGNDQGNYSEDQKAEQAIFQSVAESGIRESQMMQAIQTRHSDGNYYRSRLEARWAVFFNALGINYEYEKEGYVLEDGTWYLPDFWMPDLNLWVEIKGKKDDAFDDELNAKLALFCKAGRSNLLLLAGNIGWDEYVDDGFTFIKPSYEGKLFIGNFKYIAPYYPTTYSMEILRIESLYDFLSIAYAEGIISRLPIPFKIDQSVVDDYIELDREYYRKVHGIEHPGHKYGLTVPDVAFGEYISTDGETYYWVDGIIGDREFEQHQFTENIKTAYSKARSARFDGNKEAF